MRQVTAYLLPSHFVLPVHQEGVLSYWDKCTSQRKCWIQMQPNKLNVEASTVAQLEETLY